MEFNNVFNNVYVINLDIHKSRMNNTDRELAKYNIKYNRWPGYVPASGPNKNGVAIAHRDVVLHAAKNRMKNVVIFEDDIHITQKFESACNNMIKFINSNDWHMIFLGGHSPSVGHEVYPDIFEVVETYAAHAYIVNASIYKILLDIINKSIRIGNDRIAFDVAWVPFMQQLPSIKVYTLKNVINQMPSVGYTGERKDYTWKETINAK